jgi:hypothetical protein
VSEDAESIIGERVEAFCGRVCGTVVHDHDLEINVDLAARGRQGGAREQRPPVARRDDDADLRPRGSDLLGDHDVELARVIEAW